MSSRWIGGVGEIALLVALALSWELQARADLLTHGPVENAARAAGAWLEQEQNPDGSWGSEAATRSLLTSSAVVALRANGRRDTAYYRGVAWLENHGSRNLDSEARRILALRPHGDDVGAAVSRVIQAQRLSPPGDAGWGLSEAYQGSVLDTALVLQAHAVAGFSADVPQAIDYLEAEQLPAPASGWSFGDAGSGSASLDAQVLLALVAYTIFDPSLSGSIEAASTGLEAKVSATSPVIPKALVLHALIALGADSPLIAELTDSLVAGRNPEGSWGGDPYATALALRSLAAVLGTDDPDLSLRVEVNDLELRRGLNRELGRNEVDSLSRAEMARLSTFTAVGKGIADLGGLEWAANLQHVDLRNNAIVDLTPLMNLSEIQVLNLAGNPLSESQDVDGDGLSDREEVEIVGTSPLSSDSDGDLYSDWQEVVHGTDPLDASSRPEIGVPSGGTALRLLLVVVLMGSALFALGTAREARRIG
jgi:hypothetical protein